MDIESLSCIRDIHHDSDFSPIEPFEPIKSSKTSKRGLPNINISFVDSEPKSKSDSCLISKRSRYMSLIVNEECFFLYFNFLKVETGQEYNGVHYEE